MISDDIEAEIRRLRDEIYGANDAASARSVEDIADDESYDDDEFENDSSQRSSDDDATDAPASDDAIVRDPEATESVSSKTSPRVDDEENVMGDIDSDSSTSDLELIQLRKEVALWERARKRVYGDREEDDSDSEESDNVVDREFEDLERTLIRNQNKVRELRGVLSKLRSSTISESSASSSERDGDVGTSTEEEDVNTPRPDSRRYRDHVIRMGRRERDDSHSYCGRKRPSPRKHRVRPSPPRRRPLERFRRSKSGEQRVSRPHARRPSTDIVSESNDDEARRVTRVTDADNEIEEDDDRIKSWRKLGLMPWRDARERERSTFERLRQDYSPYFKMLDNHVPAEMVRFRMRKAFVGERIVDRVLRCHEAQRDDETTNKRGGKIVSRIRGTREKINNPVRKARRVEKQLSDALSLLALSTDDHDAPMNRITAASASKTASFVAAHASLSVKMMLSTLQQVLGNTVHFRPRTNQTNGKASKERLRSIRRVALLKELEHARREKKKRESSFYRSKNLPLFRRKQLERRRRSSRLRRELKRRMAEVESRERKSEEEAERAMKQRVKRRVKRVEELLERQRAAQGRVQEEMNRRDALKAKEVRERRETKKFWKALIKGNASSES